MPKAGYRYKHSAFGDVTFEYNTWANMKARCSNVDHKDYPNYGGRGIIVCDAWKDSFRKFIKDMGKKPSPAYSLDRIDNDGNYEPNNCRWANWRTQGRNRGVAVIIKCGDTEVTLAKFAEDFGLDFYELKEYFARPGQRAKEEFYAAQA